MVDVPPAAVALAALRSASRARLARGYATWRIGRLSPGEKRNIVLATAVNADLASDRADTRLRAKRRVPPATG